MNDTLKVIVAVLEAGRPEMQVAAAQILGELRAKEQGAVRALATAARRSPVLGRFAFDALAKIGTPEGWVTIAQGLLEGDALADHAAQLLGEAGAAAQSVLANFYASAATDQRVRILTILARTVSRDCITVFVQALLTPELTDVAARLLLGAGSQFDAPLQKALREAVGRHLGDPLPEACLGNLVAVLAHLDGAASKPTLVRFTGKDVAPRVRSAAFLGLRGSRFTAAQVKGMMGLLEDPTQKEVHDAVREVLADLPELPEGLLPLCKRLLAARVPEQRLFALRMLRTAGGAEMAKVAIRLLDHEDQRFRAAAAAALANNHGAIEPLLRLLQTTRHGGLAEAAAEVLKRHVGRLSPRQLRDSADRVVKLLQSNPRAADLLFDVVLTLGGAAIVPRIVDHAVRLRRSRRFAEPLHLLARLAASPHGGDEARYQLALTKLLTDMARPPAQPDDGAAPGNATMGFFAALVRSGFPLGDRLRKETSLQPEALLRVATHFGSAVGPERRFGTELLRHLATRTKGRAGAEARVALRAAGM
ncbi:MAG: hypothetical protein FJ265_10265 [Planctomycetes bacterium]|nr:hypothetical protein [Planctomycetota bacterium]